MSTNTFIPKKNISEDIKNYNLTQFCKLYYSLLLFCNVGCVLLRMCADKEKVANRFGRCFHRKMERFELEDLKRGDHIVEERYFAYLLPTYWHHMIVERVELEKPEPITVIHYSGGKTIFSGSGSKVCRDSFQYTSKK